MVGGVAFLCVGKNPAVRTPDIVFATTRITVFLSPRDAAKITRENP